MVIGTLTCPAERLWIFATWLTIWSKAGKTNPSNWISHTGRYPRMARPTAVPTIPDSASGVSMTRSSPKSFCRPSVIRKTPPSLPTSSPMMTTLGSSSIALRRPSFRAFAIVKEVPITEPLLIRDPRGGVQRPVRSGGWSCGRLLEAAHEVDELVALDAQLLGRGHVHVVEQRLRGRVGQRPAAAPDVLGELLGLVLD